MFQKRLVIDGRGHLLGRLASIVAKEILNGQHVVVVRCEGINISGEHFRAKLKYWDFKRKRCNVNPSKGPYHFRAPSKIFWRTVRGMIPHKTVRGEAALARMKVFEGIPAPYDKVQRKVVPSALRALRLRTNRKYTDLGRLGADFGWKYSAVVEQQEEKRKTFAAAYYARKKALLQVKAKALAEATQKLSADERKILETYNL